MKLKKQRLLEVIIKAKKKKNTIDKREQDIKKTLLRIVQLSSFKGDENDREKGQCNANY